MNLLHGIGRRRKESLGWWICIIVRVYSICVVRSVCSLLGSWRILHWMKLGCLFERLLLAAMCFIRFTSPILELLPILDVSYRFLQRSF